MAPKIHLWQFMVVWLTPCHLSFCIFLLILKVIGVMLISTQYSYLLLANRKLSALIETIIETIRNFLGVRLVCVIHSAEIRGACTLRKKVLQSTFFGASGCHK